MPWTLQDAKAQFSEVVRRAEDDGPQHVTVRGKPAVVVLSEAEFARLTKQSRRVPLGELLRNSPIAGLELQIARSRDPGRKIKL
ncbi:MAG: type II toxin-antitoxin system Phd/YefM family antitoxin [Archangium sp.]